MEKHKLFRYCAASLCTHGYILLALGIGILWVSGINCDESSCWKAWLRGEGVWLAAWSVLTALVTKYAEDFPHKKSLLVATIVMNIVNTIVFIVFGVLVILVIKTSIVYIILFIFMALDGITSFSTVILAIQVYSEQKICQFQATLPISRDISSYMVNLRWLTIFQTVFAVAQVAVSVAVFLTTTDYFSVFIFVGIGVSGWLAITGLLGVFMICSPKNTHIRKCVFVFNYLGLIATFFAGPFYSIPIAFYDQCNVSTYWVMEKKKRQDCFDQANGLYSALIVLLTMQFVCTIRTLYLLQYVAFPASRSKYPAINSANDQTQDETDLKAVILVNPNNDSIEAKTSSIVRVTLEDQTSGSKSSTMNKSHSLTKENEAKIAKQSDAKMIKPTELNLKENAPPQPDLPTPDYDFNPLLKPKVKTSYDIKQERRAAREQNTLPNNNLRKLEKVAASDAEKPKENVALVQLSGSHSPEYATVRKNAVLGKSNINVPQLPTPDYEESITEFQLDVSHDSAVSLVEIIKSIPPPAITIDELNEISKLNASIESLSNSTDLDEESDSPTEKVTDKKEDVQQTPQCPQIPQSSSSSAEFVLSITPSGNKNSKPQTSSASKLEPQRSKSFSKSDDMPKIEAYGIRRSQTITEAEVSSPFKANQDILQKISTSPTYKRDLSTSTIEEVNENVGYDDTESVTDSCFDDYDSFDDSGDETFEHDYDNIEGMGDERFDKYLEQYSQKPLPNEPLYATINEKFISNVQKTMLQSDSSGSSGFSGDNLVRTSPSRGSPNRGSPTTSFGNNTLPITNGKQSPPRKDSTPSKKSSASGVFVANDSEYNDKLLTQFLERKWSSLPPKPKKNTR